MIASGCALAKTARSLGFHGLPELQQACDRQEPEARAVVEAAAKAMTRAVVNIHRRYQPEVVAVGGGVTEHLPALYERTAELFSQYHLSEHVPHGTIPSARALRVDRALLGDDAGVIGAAQLATAHHGMP